MEIDPTSAIQEMVEQSDSNGMMGSMMQDLAFAIPGVDEAMSFAEIMKHVKSMEYSVIVFDTAPTGHTLRFLSFPTVLEKALGKLSTLSGRIGPMINQMSSLMGGQVDATEDMFAKLESMRAVITEVNTQFKDPEKTTFVCVCISEFLSLYETERLVQELTTYEIDTHNIVVNQLLFPKKSSNCEHCRVRHAMQQKYLNEAHELYDEFFHIIQLPLLTEEVRGPQKLQEFKTPPPPPADPAPAAQAQAPVAESSSIPSTRKEISEDEEPKKRRPYRFWPTTRPSISLERPRQYSRPVGVGILPAYDHALAYIKRDSAQCKAELEKYEAELAVAEKEGKVEEVARLREKVGILEVQSEINLPSVRWKARNGLADMSKKVYRHLVEQRWREDGALDLLMERIHQMNVVPDMLPALHPSFDLRINFPEPPPEDIRLRTRVKRKYQKVEPGVYLLPEQTRKHPQVYTTVFHTESRLYTMVMVDLDVPDYENETFQGYLHWLQPNISLSSSSTTFEVRSHTKYIPPHPQKGTPYHRYVIILAPQADNLPIEVPKISDEERLGFNYREFAETYGLDASKGGAAHMWREVWDETVSKLYQDVLHAEEPVFGRMPTPDRYRELKMEKKYI
ncbi:hypothetical protein EUX98_g3788 [Antrodiella citrinella]|uniref:ArsA/GET3 Anion-transporting ATPase-like domain-containing protein n=1 Tax=Antrodiella citrinella TaxID=2447956 RepID=A0A4S4MXQ9_9APHY|nr:hypothetical protein EUX98_g3788 [Antrodiella citrinella]